MDLSGDEVNGGRDLPPPATTPYQGDALVGKPMAASVMSPMSPEKDGPLSSTVPPAEPSSTLLSASPAVIHSWPPTEVKRWQTCPVFRQYSKTWEPRASQWTPHATVGTAIHAAIATHLRGLIDASISRVDLVVQAEESGRSTLHELYVPQETWAEEGLEKLVLKGYRILRDALEGELLVGAKVLAVEWQWPGPIPPGVRVPRLVDCILERNDYLEVWDWKTKINLDWARFGEETERATLHQWQLLDYSWHVQEQLRRPVGLSGWGLVILGPKASVRFLPVRLSLERLRQWRVQALRVWEMMNQPAWMNFEACTDRHLHFGKECQFLPACHSLNGDESLFEGLYKRKDDHGVLNSD